MEEQPSLTVMTVASLEGWCGVLLASAIGPQDGDRLVGDVDGLTSSEVHVLAAHSFCLFSLRKIFLYLLYFYFEKDSIPLE